MKIEWHPFLIVPEGTRERNAEACKERGFPYIGSASRPPLAVVGGAPSVARYVDELRNFPGDVWVSGSAFPWAKENGIDATFFTIDMHEDLAKDCKGARKAVVSTMCHPKVYEELRDADVEVFDLTAAWGTSVTAAMFTAVEMGYRDITFYGCDSSYERDTHAYRSEYWETNYDPLFVVCGGSGYWTSPCFLMQAEFMAEAIRMSPALYRVRSDGLLPAMVEHGDYDITGMSRARAEGIKKQLEAAPCQ